MARIRTIKPEFFTSEDIVALSPMARLLYIALWCEADREGRFQWKPRTFKMRYFPADDLEIDTLATELLESGLVTLYGDGLAYIPTFTTHQHVNPREAASLLPAPVGGENPTRGPRVSTRESTVSDAQVGREGKEGKEREASHRSRGSRLPSDWSLTDDYKTAALEIRQDWMPEHLETIAATFRDYWNSQPGSKGVKLDWLATWRNWCRNDRSKFTPKPSDIHPMQLPKGHPVRVAYETRGI